MELLSTFSFDDFTNGQARPIFGTKRIATYNRLAQLRQWGILEKRPHSYRVSQYAEELTRYTALMFKGLITGRVFEDSTASLKAILGLAREGVESKFARGRIDDNEYREGLKLIEKFEKQLV